jgi:ribonuclease J
MVEAFKVCHSIPDCLGVYIQTKDAKIVSTGDFRFDFSTEGDQTDINKIAEIGLRDVDLLLCESTNGEKPGFSVSEQVIIDNLRRLITSAKGRVFVSLFASNLERGQHLLQIALQCKRKLVLLGRSMKNAMNTAMDIKYLNIGKSDIIENLKEINEYPDNEVFVLMTGSQGEEMAALNQMAIGNNPFFAIKPTDTIILSSSPIPGNFRKVEELVNKLYKSRANIVVNTAALNIHASGHATQQEQQLMIKLVNPRYLVPIHGEIKMHFALKKTAHTSGIKREQTIIVQNGQKVEINDHVVSATTEVVDTSDVYIDGNSVSNNSDNVLKFRQMMSSDGIFSVVLIFDKEKRALKFMPHLSSRGIFYTKTFLSLITKISYSIKDKIDE